MRLSKAWPNEGFEDLYRDNFIMAAGRVLRTLGAEGVIPSRQIEGFLRDFKQFTHNIPSGKIVGFLKFAHQFDHN